MKLRRLIQIESNRQRAYENKFARSIRKALIAQAEHYLDHGYISNDMQVTINELYETIMPDYLSRQWEQLERNDLQKKERFFLDSWRRWIAEYTITSLATKVTNIDKTTQEEISRQTLAGATAGETTQEIQERIIKVFNGKATKARARMIARTEVGEAVNLAKTKSAQDWGLQTDEELGKLWVHRGAKDPRDWHMTLDTGVPIPINDTWTVTNPNTGETDLMQHPHDSTASAGNVINCGCQVIYTRLNFRRRF